MKILKLSLQGKAKQDLGRKLALQHILRNPDRLILVGPISIEIRHGFGLDQTEQLLESLVDEGLLRPANAEELAKAGKRHGYYLTEDGLRVATEL